MNVNDTMTLFRPVGPKELELIRASGNRAFPPRLPEQPIFYPVLNEDYAVQIAHDWNVKDSGAGYVTRFHVRKEFIEKYPIQTVGGFTHQEFWIPAEDMDAFNQNMVGTIEIIAQFEK
jgi:hypothetical protein